jgi:putative acetyltransferase
MTNSKVNLRSATSTDQQQIVDLISRVYSEYGEKICLEDADKDLLDIDGYYFGQGGAFWVLDDGQQVLGTHAAHASFQSPDVCTFRRLYLDTSLRGSEWGALLMQTTIDWARDHRFPRVEFWSDTRFERAHRFFKKFGFNKTGEVRTMHDGFEPYQEYFFFLELEPKSDE